MVEKRTRRIILFGLLLLIVVGQWQGGVGGQTLTPPVTPTSPVMAVPYYTAPKAMQFCGEPVPLENQDTMERFDREFTIVVYSHAQVYLWLKRMQRYFPWIEKQLELNRLPEDMKYVAVAESDLLTSACSPAGAVGPWQFIAGTGSRYGLDQSSQIDERFDFERATASAFRYLQDLHEMFQSWTLAAAAYNCGEKRIQKEVARQKSTSYYALKLPLETERYIFRILAIKEVLGHPERYGYYLPNDAGYPATGVDRVNVNIPYSMPILSVAEAAGITYRDFKLLNPAFVSDTIPRGSYTLKVPEGKAREFTTRLEAARENYVPSLVNHKVARGETLSSIASHYGVSIDALCEWNQLQGNTVQVGQTLKIQK